MQVKGLYSCLNAELVAEPIFPFSKLHVSHPYFLPLFAVDYQNIISQAQAFHLLFWHNGPRKHQAIAAPNLRQTYYHHVSSLMEIWQSHD